MNHCIFDEESIKNYKKEEGGSIMVKIQKNFTKKVPTYPSILSVAEPKVVHETSEQRSH